MTSTGKRLPNDISITDFFQTFAISEFPHLRGTGQKPYPEQYTTIVSKIEKIHKRVEQAVFKESLDKYITELTEIANSTGSDTERLRRFLEAHDPAVYLNNHGVGHIECVLRRASDLLHLFKDHHLSPYEYFFLLCSIQTHDIGLIKGREDHEKHAREIIEQNFDDLDAFGKKIVGNIARVHSGKFGESRDLISKLVDVPFHGQTIRCRILSSVLRFADELADDCTRIDEDSISNGEVPEYAMIYHMYSFSLKSVKVYENIPTRQNVVELHFNFPHKIARTAYKKRGKDRYLLDEIYDRTLKMETERRYCMRFLRPHLSIDRIDVKIEIDHDTETLEYDEISYSLSESGYPDDKSLSSIKSFNDTIPTAAEENEKLGELWKVHE